MLHCLPMCVTGTATKTLGMDKEGCWLVSDEWPKIDTISRSSNAHKHLNLQLFLTSSHWVPYLTNTGLRLREYYSVTYGITAFRLVWILNIHIEEILPKSLAQSLDMLLQPMLFLRIISSASKMCILTILHRMYWKHYCLCISHQPTNKEIPQPVHQISPKYCHSHSYRL